MTNEQHTFRTLKTIMRTFDANLLLMVVVFLTIIMSVSFIAVSFTLQQLLDSALIEDFASFWRMIIVLCGLTVIQMVAIFFRTKLLGKYTESGIARLRSLVADNLIRLSIYELEKKHSGDITSRMNNDLNQVREFANSTLIEIIYQPLAAIGAVCYLVTLNWKLTLITTLVVPFIFKFSSVFTKPIAQYMQELQEKLAEVNKGVQDTITGMESVRAYNLQLVLAKKHDLAVDRSVKTALRVIFIKCMLSSFSAFISAMPFFVCFGFGGYWVVKGQMTAGALIAFITLLNPLTYPIGELPTLLGNLKGQMVATARILELLNLPKEREQGEDFEINSDTSLVVFKDVVFSYPDGSKVLDHVNFQIQQGEKVALVGLSGSGKSTILKLILGYYEDYAGEIIIFGHPLADWNLRSLREKVGLVAQDSYLFPGTIADNIGFGKKDATHSDIVAAAKAAHAHDFVSELRDGYQSEVGEFGDKLSGGQRQRISIARAILKNAPLLLLDEATSALDISSESMIQEALDYYIGNQLTCMVISHRLSTIQNADRIIVLGDGRIVEMGSHRELLELNGEYKNLYMHQFSSELQNGEKEGIL